jgi:hypothetical protein
MNYVKFIKNINILKELNYNKIEIYTNKCV